ncbi:MAG: DUF3458 domain-containing protein, partial [Succinivibrio sp.]
IRMIHTLIGEIRFRQGLRDYLATYDGQAVTIEDFLVCMEKAGEIDLGQFRNWYTQAGTPNVSAKWSYDDKEGKLLLTLSQHTAPTPDGSSKNPFYIPVRISFLDPEGHDVHPAELSSSGIIILDSETKAYSFTLDKDTLPVILRDFSAPVKLDAPYTTKELQHMLSFCDDAFIKVDAAVTMQKRYIHENLSKKSADEFTNPDELIASYKELLTSIKPDTDLHLLNETLKIQSVSSLMETFDIIDIEGLARCRYELEKKVAVSLEQEFFKVYNQVRASGTNYSVVDMGRRAVNNAALHMYATALAATGRADKASSLVLKHYNSSCNMTDSLAAMTDAVHLNLNCKEQILKDFEKKWADDALTFDNFFRVQATIPDHSAIENVKTLLNHRSYDWKNPNRVRALPGALALLNPVALHDISGDGYKLLCSEIKRLNKVNPSVAARILTPLLSFKRFDSKRQQLIRTELNALMEIHDLSRSIYEKVSSALKD